MNNTGRAPEDVGDGVKAQWLRRKLDIAVRHLREIEDYNRVGDFPAGTYEGSFQEAQADRARNIYEQITSDFYEGKLGQPTMRQERDAALVRAEKAETQVAGARDVTETLLVNGHFYECLPGQRGGKPNDYECSFACTLMRSFLAVTAPAASEMVEEVGT